MSTETTPPSSDGHSHDGHGVHQAPTSFWRKYIFSLDHKVIGIQFLFSSLLFAVLGGSLAMLIRTQLAWPFEEIPGFFPESGGVMLPESYIALVTMHGTIMIFFVIIPILSGAFGNFLIPLMIGARDMAFPALNMLSYWFMVPAFIVMLSAFFVEGGTAAAGSSPRRSCGSTSPPRGANRLSLAHARAAARRSHLTAPSPGRAHPFRRRRRRCRGTRAGRPR